MEGRSTAWRHGTVEREAAKGVCGNSGKKTGCGIIAHTSPMRDEATQLASVAHHDGKCDDASRIGIDGSVVDSEYLSSLCNPWVPSLRAEASSRAIVDIDDSVADINNLAPSYPLLHSPSQLVASAQLTYKTETSDGIHPHHKCLAISHLKMLRQAADSHPAALPCLVILQLARQHLTWPLFERFLYSNNSVIQTILLFKQFLLSIGGLW